MHNYADEMEYWLQEDIAPQYVRTKLDEIRVAGSIRLGILKKASQVAQTSAAHSHG